MNKKFMMCYTSRKFLKVMELYSVIVILSVIVMLSDGFVTEQNNYIKLVTRDSGTFIGTKEVFSLPAFIDEGQSQGKSGKRINKGQSGDHEDKVYYAFKGIPYAKPPVGKLIWKAPELLDIKSGPVGATKFKSICSQWDSMEEKVIGSQDCLYLNIFTPRLHLSTGSQLSSEPTTTQNYSKYDDDPRTAVRLLPVLIYVHGGDFTSNSGNFEGHERFMKEKVLFVTFNYRLGIFGFLSTGCKTLPGNYGLLDQVFALKWIKKNIHRFGGDPGRVTIFGEVSYLTLSPFSEGLFNNAILMSSSASIFTPGAINPNPKEYFESVVKAAACPESKTEGSERLADILNDCLNIRPAETLIRIQESLTRFWKYPKGLTPVIDGEFQEFGVFPHPLTELMNTTNFTNTPLMIGVNNIEGYSVFQEFYKKSLYGVKLEDLEVKTKENLKKDLAEIKPELTDGSFDGVWNYYFGGVNFTQASAFGLLYLQLIHLFGDVTVYNGHWRTLQSLASKKELSSFNYVFDYNSDLWNKYIDPDQNMSISANAVYPWDEEYLLFLPPNFSNINNSDAERNSETSRNENAANAMANADDMAMANAMVRIWSSFASYGTPKKAVAFRNWTRWSKFGQTNLNQTTYYHIRLNASHMESDFRKKEYEFWLDALPTMTEMATEVESLEDWPILFWVALGVTIFLIVFIAIIVYFIRH